MDRQDFYRRKTKYLIDANNILNYRNIFKHLKYVINKELSTIVNFYAFRLYNQPLVREKENERETCIEGVKTFHFITICTSQLLQQVALKNFSSKIVLSTFKSISFLLVVLYLYETWPFTMTKYPLTTI